MFNNSSFTEFYIYTIPNSSRKINPIQHLFLPTLTNYGEMFAEAFQGYLTSNYTRQSIETNMPMTWSILKDLSARWAA